MIILRKIKGAMRNLRVLVKSIGERWRCRGLWVLADSRDNSISFSPKLWRRIRREVGAAETAKVVVVRCGGGYAFAVNADVGEDTQLADIQWNGKHGTVGFESLVPTVNRMFYDMGLPFGIAAKLSVERLRIGEQVVWRIVGQRMEDN